jgi:hypothetical protein
MKYQLKIEEHEEFGTNGAVILSPRFRSYHHPETGRGIAHDIIEHPTKIHPDPFIDELLALGAVIAGRVEHGYNVTIGGIANDIESLLNSNPFSLTTDSVYTNNYTLKDQETVEMIRKAVATGIIDHRGMWISKYDTPLDFDEKLIVSWICEGYTRFKKRFKNYSIYNISNHVFDDITNQVGKWIKGSDIGEKADLHVNFSRYIVELIPHD